MPLFVTNSQLVALNISLSWRSSSSSTFFSCFSLLFCLSSLVFSIVLCKVAVVGSSVAAVRRNLPCVWRRRPSFSGSPLQLFVESIDAEIYGRQRHTEKERETLHYRERERESPFKKCLYISIYLSIFPACHVDLRCTRTIQIRSEKTFPPPTRKSSFFFFSVCLFVMKRRECVRCDVVPALLPPPNDVTSKQKKK